MSDALPVARVERRPGPGWTRLLPILAVLLALVLLREVWRERGPRITIHAADGHGLRPGDALRHRGIDVGEVESVALAPGGEAVALVVRLARSAEGLATSGARFWVARPVLGVEGVRGLETALGARYLAVLPGPAGGGPCRDFVALEEPPLFAAEDAGALEIVLRSDQRAGLARGAPVLYRGLPIGSLVSVGLASDASAVELRARIQASYAELVRADSRFWRTGGAELSFGLGGLELSIASAQALWLGGVALATPNQPGPRAVSGQRFELAPRAEEEWTRWRPALPVGRAWLDEAATLPTLAFARLTWEARGWFGRTRGRAGWLVDEGRAWLGPADVLAAPEEAEAGSAALELGGARLDLSQAPAWSDGVLARRAHAGFEGAATLAPSLTRRLLSGPEDLLLCADPALAPMAVAAEHLSLDGNAWRLAPRFAFDEGWHGALALARDDGAWVGLLLVEDGQGRITPLPAD